jgi:membrane associated rhomboid family serine protease
VIFPFLRGLVALRRAPVTYALVAINLLVFIFTFNAFLRADHALDELLEDDVFVATQGSAFAVMIAREPGRFSKTLHALSASAIDGDSDSRRVLGSLALRNRVFMEQAADYEFGGDEVALADWRTKFAKLERIQAHHPSYQWGISQRTENWLHWITYQFAHSGFTHLFWNMLFLLLFGSFVETSLGGLAVALTYLGGGLLGAWSFSLLSGISSSPLVGASAAVSGLMGLVTVAFWKEKLKFFYWLFPMQGYFGFAFLPSWLVIIVFAVPDLSGFFSSVPEFGSIAYSAHLGGMTGGAVLGGLIIFRRFKSE